MLYSLSIHEPLHIPASVLQNADRQSVPLVCVARRHDTSELLQRPNCTGIERRTASLSNLSVCFLGDFALWVVCGSGPEKVRLQQIRDTRGERSLLCFPLGYTAWILWFPSCNNVRGFPSLAGLPAEFLDVIVARRRGDTPGGSLAV